MGVKFRLVVILAVLGVALFALKPLGQIRSAELLRNTHIILLKKPNFSRNITKSQRPEIRLEVTSEMFDGVPVRIYRASNNKSEMKLLPAVVYFHGGGWVKGTVEKYDPFTRNIAMKLRITVVSVEYRLAPKYMFPIPLDDCHKVAMHVLKHAPELGIDASRVILMGDSAGGNLATVVSQRMKNTKPPLFAQILIYPVTQALNLQLPSFMTEDTREWSAGWMTRYYLPYFTGSVNDSLLNAMVQGTHVSDRVYELYSKHVDYRKLPEPYQKNYVEPQRSKTDLDAARVLEPFITNPEISPLLSDDLSGLPATMILTVEFDPLRDEGALYAIRLKEAGVNVHYLHYEEGKHGACCFEDDKAKNSKLAIRMNADIFTYANSLLWNAAV